MKNQKPSKLESKLSNKKQKKKKGINMNLYQFCFLNSGIGRDRYREREIERERKNRLKKLGEKRGQTESMSKQRDMKMSEI